MKTSTRSIRIEPRRRSDAETNREITIRIYRRDRRFTQQEMADKIGISRSYLAAIERGHYPISAETAPKIARITKQKSADVISEWELKFGKKFRKVAKMRRAA